MDVRDVDPEALDALVTAGGLVFVDFWATWCAPCKQFALAYERVAADNPAVVFVKVNVEEQSALAATFEIRSIPHLMVFKFGKLIFSEAGSMPEKALKELVEQALKLDAATL